MAHEHTLDKIDQRTVLALGAELGRLQQEAQETGEALGRLANRLAGERGWTEGEGRPRFEQRRDGTVVLVIDPVEAGEAGEAKGE